MGFKDGAKEAVIGMVLGILVPVFINSALKQSPDTITFLHLLEFGTFLGLIKKMDTIEKIPMTTAAGYFLMIFTLGSIMLPIWEVEFHVIVLIIYLASKMKR